MLKGFKALMFLLVVFGAASVNIIFDRDTNIIQFGEEVYAAGYSCTWSNPGDQTWTVPQTATYKIECWGARGGNGGASGYGTSGGTGSYGCYNSTIVNLNAGSIVSIVVGGVGSNGNQGNILRREAYGGEGGSGGYPGGGSGGTAQSAKSSTESMCYGGGGGGGGGGYSRAWSERFSVTASGGNGGTGALGVNAAGLTFPGGSGGSGGVTYDNNNGGINQNTYTGYSGKIVITKTNNTSVITVASPESNKLYSPVGGKITLSLSANVTGYDSGDSETIFYRIDGAAGQPGIQLCSNVTTTTSSFSFSGTIDITNLTEGSHTLYLWSNDQKNTNSAETPLVFKVDKLSPTLGQVTVTPSSSSSITVSGSATDFVGLDANPYLYNIGTNTSSWIKDSTYTQNSLTPNTQYAVQFKARDYAGQETTYNQNMYTLAEMPSITVNNQTNSTVDVNVMDNNPDNTEYQILFDSQYVGQDGELTITPTWIALQGKKITVKGLSSASTYNIKAMARNADGIETGFTTPGDTKPLYGILDEKPILSAVSSGTQITLTWTLINGADSYDIAVDGVEYDNVSSPYVHDNPQAGSHTYKVRGKNISGPGPWSDLISFSTSNGQLPAPAGLKATVSGSSIILNWDSVAGASSYDLEIDNSTALSINGTTYTHNNLASGSLHQYRVRAEGNGMLGLWSTQITTYAAGGNQTNTNAVTYSRACVNGNEFDYVMTASNIKTFDNRNITVTYNTNELQVTDLCSQTPEQELTAGSITGSSITVSQFASGVIVFKVNKSIPSGKVWSGIINKIKFKALKDCTATVTYKIDSTTPESIISPTALQFDMNNNDTANVTLQSGETLSDIKAGQSSLKKDADYKVSGNIINVSGYLKYIFGRWPGVVCNLTFTTTSGKTATLSATKIPDLITPSAVQFSINSPSSVSTTISAGQTLSGIKVGNAQLVSGTDYNVSGSIITISQNYLSGFFAQTQQSCLMLFSFSGGGSQTLAVTPICQNSTVSPSAITFDKGMLVDTTITMNLNGNTLSSINNGTSALTQTNYTVSGSAVTLKSSYLKILPTGNTILTFNFSGGSSQNVAVTVLESVITPTTMQYDMNNPAAANITIQEGQTLSCIKAGNTALNSNDYKVSGNVVNVSSYLNYIFTKWPSVTCTLTFEMTSGRKAVLNATKATVNNSSVTPSAITFDKGMPADAAITMTLNGNTLSSIMDGTGALAQTNYTVSGSAVTLKSAYLNALSAGNTTLTFNFSGGSPQSVSVTVLESAITPSAIQYDPNIIATANVTIQPGETLANIKAGTASLNPANGDYSVSGNVVNLNGYLNYIFGKWPDGVCTLTFEMTSGRKAILKATKVKN